jgi:hypothetical protein
VLSSPVPGDGVSGRGLGERGGEQAYLDRPVFENDPMGLVGKVMVEAAGVEPASGGAMGQATPCSASS